MVTSIAPHGGELAPRIVQDASHRESLLKESHRMPGIRLNPRQISDVEMLAIGAFSPLRGFMNPDDYRRVLAEMRLSSGLPWPMPITLAVSKEAASPLREGAMAALLDHGGQPLAVLEVESKYGYDRQEEARRVFRTESAGHPAVRRLLEQGEVCVGGAIRVINLPGHAGFEKHVLTPSETRTIFSQRDWKRVVGFQTRNPIHRAHEYIIRCALEMCDGALIHPIVGETKGDDIPANVRMRCYETLLQKYLPLERMLLAINPAYMRYGGPREAILHAIVRKNYGCTHFIVGRDHAGVGNFYGPFEAQEIFGQFGTDELGIVPLFFDNAFYCGKCACFATPKTCPHDASDRIALSGSAVRDILRAGGQLPAEFTRSEVADILTEWWRTTNRE